MVVSGEVGEADFPSTGAAGLLVLVDAASALRRAMVSLFGRRPLMPFRTGSCGKGVGSRYKDGIVRRVCLDSEEVDEDEEEHWLDSGFERVTVRRGTQG